MRPVMVLGCTSDAGKSLLATALCRWFAREGIRVAPFKAQNMSNNARVVATPHGAGEIGVAQWLQARAAGVEPDVRMNPVLLKPEADTQSQVVVRGRVDRVLTNTPWQDRHAALWTPMAEAFDELHAEFDLVVLEGAGSPAEINLVDQVNNRMIEHADAAGLLVSDIDRGGSFAHLYGTWALVPDATRQRLAGFVLNKFRGDPSLLAPGPETLTEKTGMSALGVVPMVAHDLPREEGASEHFPPADAQDAGPTGEDVTTRRPQVVLPRLPFGSNLDEFHLLAHATSVHWAQGPGVFARLDPNLDLIVLPGSKHVAADATWMQARGIDRAVVAAAARGVRVVGVCGGAMMLGREFHDPTGSEGGGETGRRPSAMLGLLDVRTVMAPEKAVHQRTVTFQNLPVHFRSLDGLRCDGYEIRYGQISSLEPSEQPRDERAWWGHRNVLATTVHGLFESPHFLERLLGIRVDPVLEPTFERLADLVEEHLDTEALRRMVG